MRQTTPKLLRELHALFEDPGNLRSHLAYYQALCAFVKSNLDLFKPCLQPVLGGLLALDPQEYLLPEQTLTLELEPRRLNRHYRHVAPLAADLTGSLWEMVAVPAAGCCPRCGDALCYLLHRSAGSEHVLLECRFWGHLFDLSGAPWRGPRAESILALNRGQLLLAGILT